MTSVISQNVLHKAFLPGKAVKGETAADCLDDGCSQLAGQICCRLFRILHRVLEDGKLDEFMVIKRLIGLLNGFVNYARLANLDERIQSVGLRAKFLDILPGQICHWCSFSIFAVARASIGHCHSCNFSQQPQHVCSIRNLYAHICAKPHVVSLTDRDLTDTFPVLFSLIGMITTHDWLTNGAGIIGN